MNSQSELEPFAGEAFVRALDNERQGRSLSWRDVARAVNVSASTLTRLRQGSVPDLDTFVRLCDWAGLRAENYLNVNEDRSRNSLEDVAVLLRADPDLGEESVELIVAMIKAAYAKHAERP